MPRPLLITILLIVTCGLGLGLVLPQYQKFSQIKSQVQNKESELRSKKEYFAQVKQISQELTTYDSSLAKIDSALPQDPSLPSLFNLLQQTSSQSGLVLEKISLESVAPQEKKEIKDILVEVQVAGVYSAFKDFLSALEKSARLIEVPKLSFSTPKSIKDPFSFKLQIKTHSY